MITPSNITFSNIPFSNIPVLKLSNYGGTDKIKPLNEYLNKPDFVAVNITNGKQNGNWTCVDFKREILPKIKKSHKYNFVYNNDNKSEPFNIIIYLKHSIADIDKIDSIEKIQELITDIETSFKFENDKLISTFNECQDKLKEAQNKLDIHNQKHKQLMDKASGKLEELKKQKQAKEEEAKLLAARPQIVCNGVVYTPSRLLTTTDQDNMVKDSSKYISFSYN